jgi:hypothetical protein
MTIHTTEVSLQAIAIVSDGLKDCVKLLFYGGRYLKSELKLKTEHIRLKDFILCLRTSRIHSQSSKRRSPRAPINLLLPTCNVQLNNILILSINLIKIVQFLSGLDITDGAQRGRLFVYRVRGGFRGHPGKKGEAKFQNSGRRPEVLELASGKPRSFQ